MSSPTKKAILVVSYGTSHADTRIKTIDAIKNTIASTYRDCAIYEAWTSILVLSRVRERDNLYIPTVTEAMEQMKKDGITHVLVQPTHVINGIENDQMKVDALCFQKDFVSISFGDPLLTTEEDCRKVVDAITREFDFLKEKEALVLMGHGTSHYANTIYSSVNHQFKNMGYKNIFLGTVKPYSSLSALKEQVIAYNPEKIYLAPFMIAAGNHVKNNMAGADPASWSSQFTQAGFPVECILKGLGEYTSIQEIFVDHASFFISV